MARKQGFVPNRKNIGLILKEDSGIAAALDDIAEDAAAKAGGQVVKYVTDRQARSVVVDAEAQAIDGTATKAMGETAGQRSGRNQNGGFVSRSQWRRAFATGLSDAEERAKATSGGYSGLPERKQK
ncbi:hypothetical protein [Mycolicibacterium komossense]|uniref:Uncharacterized protein n=1 Tax=Mycolicibacterium komossense TaxID=1779 RepID=A0ABT3CM88_9MYCO|nr:hypothetical protein [Mycolicibacterium komossense]MCV7230669.1 hypothetical protein [Mycolicibacterium komossense]